jgi:hypothetical protein
MVVVTVTKAACMVVAMKMEKKVVVITSTKVACRAAAMGRKVVSMVAVMDMGTAITGSKVASIEMQH